MQQYNSSLVIKWAIILSNFGSRKVTWRNRQCIGPLLRSHKRQRVYEINNEESVSGGIYQLFYVVSFLIQGFLLLKDPPRPRCGQNIIFEWNGYSTPMCFEEISDHYKKVNELLLVAMWLCVFFFIPPLPPIVTASFTFL